MNKLFVLLGVSLLGVAVGAGGATYVGAQGTPAQISRTELLRKPMSGMEGKEIVVFIGDIPPGGAATRHSHPGDEAIYMLERLLRFAPDHEQPFELKAGEITFNLAKHIHRARNESSSASAKVLNCMIAEKGQPLAISAQ
jgi:quercetin dioxygenase-like cupin family protein